MSDWIFKLFNYVLFTFIAIMLHMFFLFDYPWRFLASFNFCFRKIKIKHENCLGSDVDCLGSIRTSIEDPQNNLFRTWNFSNGTEGYICHFTGIQCWHEDENRVLNIQLSSMGLRGEFPMGITGCSSMTGLDLSGNNFSGMIPNNISHMISYVTVLDLSSNQFSGEIPVNIANCTYLNSLRLDNNQLTGQIPLEIGQLSRLTAFSVAGNQLSGQVPSFINPNSRVGPDSYAGNHGLCGRPLPVCRVR